MDRESYENERTAEVINENFVAIKVDRDERPDVDTRYQAAVAAISGQGGWPLTAFLTPEGEPFFGGTYFPPEDRYGRPSLERVLLTMADAFRNRRDEVNESAGSIMEAIEHNESFSGPVAAVGPELVAKLVGSSLKQFDARAGGFGSQPKFPHSAGLDLLIDAASRGSVGATAELTNEARHAASFTLECMAKGGVYDHLAGGFHRYSVDERWVVPHFEKMAYDNSELLRNYVHGFQTFVDPGFAQVAREIVVWMDASLSDREHGGFYASQDADYSLDDDGDYFTWTRDEVAAVLSGQELALAAEYFNVGEVGNMHHNPAKNVLHVTGTLEGRGAAGGGDGRGGGRGAGECEAKAVCGAAAAADALHRPDDVHGVERHVHIGVSGGRACAGAAGDDPVRVEVARSGAGRGVAAGPRRAARGGVRRERRGSGAGCGRAGRLRVSWPRAAWMHGR